MTEQRAQRGSRRFRSRVTTRGATIVTRDITTDLRPVRADGPIHLTYCTSPVEDRRAIFVSLGLGQLQSLGHRNKVAGLRDATNLDEAVDVADDLVLCRLDHRRPDRLLRDLFHDTLATAVDRAIDRLGENSDFPSPDHLDEVCTVIESEYGSLTARLLLAAVIEWKFTAMQSVEALIARGSRFAPATTPNAASASASALGSTAEEPREGSDGDRRRDVAQPHLPVDDNTRAARKVRRAQHQAKKAQQREQTLAASRVRRIWRPTNATTTEAPKEALSADDTLRSIEEPPWSAGVRRLHPRVGPADLRDTIDRVNYPVGHVAVAFVRWGWSAEQGKHRPVVIVGATATHAWVRGIYTRDVVLGRWRATKLNDWREAGLDHVSYLEDEIREFKRSKLDIWRYRLSDADWNRICIGEVH